MNVLRLILIAAIAVQLSAGIAYSGDSAKGEALFKSNSLGKNKKSCNSCHKDGKGIDSKKKAFSVLGSKHDSLVSASNFCIKNALNGKPLDENSNDMKNMVSYIEGLNSKIKTKSAAPGY